MEKTISIKELFTEIARKWKIIVLFAVIGAVVMNVYGYSKAVAAEAAREDLHKRYEEAAPELPGYYTEDLFAMRSGLSELTVKYTLACAKIFREFVEQYGTDAEVTDHTNLEAYMLFLNAYNDLSTNMSSTQRNFFKELIRIDTKEYVDIHPEVRPYEPDNPNEIQPKWVGVGLFAGVVLGALVIATPTVNKKCR